jgi:hypothetical protein
MNDTYLVFNNAEAVHYGDIVQGELTLSLIIPSFGELSDRRSFGFRHPAKRRNGFGEDEIAGIYFDIVGDLFKVCARGVNGEPDQMDEPIIGTSWINQPTRFGIRWEAGQARFLMDGVVIYTLGLGDVGLASTPMSVFVKNGNSDDMLLSYLEVKGAQSYV